MRRVQKGELDNASFIVPAATEIKRGAKLSGDFLGDRQDLLAKSACLRCPGAPCAELRDRSGVPLCPVGAISQSLLDGSISISNSCIGCGLCVLECPPGAMELEPDGTVCVREWTSKSLVRQVSNSEYWNWLTNLSLSSEISPTQARSISKQIAKRLEKENAAVIYPLVASYFTIMGLPAVASNRGDTSSRVDVMIKTEEGLIPVEVKSFTEVDSINLKSVQQALENKLFAGRQSQLEQLDNLPSFALGFNYPSDRTGISDLVDDIFNSFGIRIGLISMPRLIEEAILAKLKGGSDIVSRLKNLKGIF